MKKFKSGFTLAEVLITLGVIGIIAAIVMPSVISSYQYKAVGVKLAKFASQLENSARPYVAMNDVFKDYNDVLGYVNESYIFKTVKNDAQISADVLKALYGDDANLEDIPAATVIMDSLTAPTKRSDLTSVITQPGKSIGYLKDGTSISVSLEHKSEYTTTDRDVVDSYKVGLPVFNINFDPHAPGLPSTVNKNFTFTVTELGYVFPHEKDNCLWSIYNADYATKAATFAEQSACNGGNTGVSTSNS